MEKRIGVIGLILESNEFAEAVNDLLHRFSDIIVGRMGLPYPERGVAVISLIVDGTTDEISALTGKLGQVRGVTVKSALSKA